MEPAREIPVVLDAEVVVVGGGPAGIAAAAASSREGARTVLIEHYGFLGGAGTKSGATTFCGLYAIIDGVPLRVVRGITNEITDALVQMGSAVDAQPAVGGRTVVVPFHAFEYKRLAETLLIQSGAIVRFHSLVVGAVVEDDSIKAVLIESKSGRQAISGAIFIDASGDGDLSAFAGVPYEKGDAYGFMQLPTTMFHIGNVDNERAENEGLPRIGELLERAEETGAYGFPRLSAIVRPQPTRGIWRANMTRIARSGKPIDGTDIDDLIFAEIEGRRQVQMYFQFLREWVPGFEKSYIIEAAPEVGIRETRRIMGEYVISEDDVLRGAEFEDAIGCNGWPTERHTADKEIQWGWIRGRGYHQIPYRSLVPKGMQNLLVAGRCLSADPIAQSSLRVAGPCFATGQAVGLAAALCVKRQENPHRLDMEHLQGLLRERGAFI
jgi:hypothetical protein